MTDRVRIVPTTTASRIGPLPFRYDVMIGRFSFYGNLPIDEARAYAEKLRWRLIREPDTFVSAVQSETHG